MTAEAAVACLLTAAALVLAGLRISGVKGQFFQAVAHVFTGGLAGAWLAGGHDPLFAWLFVGLCVVEVACAVIFRLVARRRSAL